MILSGLEIKKRLDKDIIIQPFTEDQLNPNSYNLQLAPELLMYDNTNMLHEVVPLDPRKENKVKPLKIPEEGLVLLPGILYLGKTIEHTETVNLVPRLDGRSSVGRLGIFVHVTAGFGDVGYRGQWTLELTCVHPVKVYPGMQICQISYHTISEKHALYSGRYQDTTDPQPCLLFKDPQ